MLFSVIAIVAGVIGGKAWYVAVHRGRKFDGWCIQGFVAGAAVVVAAAALAGPGVPAGAYLAAAAPALLIGMSIRRAGVRPRPAGRCPLGGLVVGPPPRLPPCPRPAARGRRRADQRGYRAGRR